jgi:NCS1 family nucleobase:cation symporter-1
MPPIAIPVEDAHAELIENGVPAHEQTMSKEKVFWAFFTPNITLTSWLFGIIAAQGLSFYWAMLALVLGNAFGALVTGLCGTMGPPTRLSSLQGSLFSFGKIGIRPPAILNWVNSAGWDAVNNIPAAAAIVLLIKMTGLQTPFWLTLLGLSVLQMIIAIYGHHFYQIIAKYMGYLLLAIFLFLGIRSLSAPEITIATDGFSVSAFILAISLAAVGSAGYVAFGADYTRYLPPDTSKRSIFWRVAGGLFISYMLMEGFGLLTASAIKDLTPDGLMTGLQALSGGFAPLVLLAAGLSVIPANAMNDNSAAYCLISSGIRIRRSISAIFGAAAGFAIALYGNGHLGTIVQDTLLLLFYWIAPWTAIVLVHWYAAKDRQKVPFHSWTPGATIFTVVTIGTIALFSSNDLYTGPIAKMLGGVDIGYYVGFVVAGAWYWLALRRQHSFEAFQPV